MYISRWREVYLSLYNFGDLNTAQMDDKQGTESLNAKGHVLFSAYFVNILPFFFFDKLTFANFKNIKNFACFFLIFLF